MNTIDNIPASLRRWSVAHLEVEKAIIHVEHNQAWVLGTFTDVEIAQLVMDEHNNALANQRPIPARVGTAWTTLDDEDLSRFFKANMDIKEMAERLERTPFSVERRLVKLGKITAA